MILFVPPQGLWISLKMVSPWNFWIVQDDFTFTANWNILAADHLAGVPDEKNAGGLPLLLTITRIGANCVSFLYVVNIIANPNSPELIHSAFNQSSWVTKAAAFPFLYAMYFVNLNCCRVGASLMVHSVIPILLWSGHYLLKMRYSHTISDWWIPKFSNLGFKLVTVCQLPGSRYER